MRCRYGCQNFKYAGTDSCSFTPTVIEKSAGYNEILIISLKKSIDVYLLKTLLKTIFDDII